MEQGITQITQRPIIAVLSFNSASNTISSYIIEELLLALASSSHFTVVDRQRLDIIRIEENFQLSGEVSDETQQSIGKKLGAQYVITGSLQAMGNNYRFRVVPLNVETATINAPTSINVNRNDKTINNLLDNPEIKVSKVRTEKSWNNFWYGNGNKFGSIGINVGTSFATPLIIGNVNITVPVFPYTFIEVGADIGLVHGKDGDVEIEDVEYFSGYYYGRFNVFVPFNAFESSIRWYFGIGGGLMDAYFTFPTTESSVQTPAMDAASGFFISKNRHLFRIGYSLRTDFFSVNNKVTVGYAYRIY